MDEPNANYLIKIFLELYNDGLMYFNKRFPSQLTDRSYRCTRNHPSNAAEGLSTFRGTTDIIFTNHRNIYKQLLLCRSLDTEK